MSTFEGNLGAYLTPDPLSFPGQSTNAVAPASAEQVAENITALVNEYSSTLYRVAFSVVRNAAEAEDMVQETFLRVLRHRDRLREIRDARIWLVRITWNLVLDRKRRSKTRPENENVDELARILPSKELGADKALIAAQRHSHVLALIDRLPAKERQVILLSGLEELSSTEIAAILKTTESTVRSRLFRARRALQSMLEKDRCAR